MGDFCFCDRVLSCLLWELLSFARPPGRELPGSPQCQVRECGPNPSSMGRRPGVL